MPITIRSKETGNLIPLWYDENGTLVTVSNELNLVMDKALDILNGRGERAVCPNRDPMRPVKPENSTYSWKVIPDEDGD